MQTQMLSKVKFKLSNVRENKDNKALVSNFGYLLLLQIAGYIFPILTIPYLSKVVGVDGFGKIAFAAGVIVWLQTITDWGFNYTATRDVARNREDNEIVSQIFSNVLWARLLLMCLSLTLLLICIAIIPYFKENHEILLVTFLLVPGQIFFPDWFFQAMERMKYLTIFNLVSKAFFTILVFIFIKEKSDFILQPLFISSGYVITGIISMYIIVVRWKVKIHPPKVKPVLSIIKESKDVFLNNIMPNLYNSFSVVLLGFSGGSLASGLFDAGNKFVNIGNQFINVLSRAFFPFLSRKLDKHIVYKNINLLTAVIFSVGLFLLAPFIIRLFFTPEFYQAIPVLQVMSISIIFITLSSVYGTNYLLIKGYEKRLRNVTFICSLLGFMLSFPLIHFYGFLGAAINITITRAFLGLAITYQAKVIRNTL